MNTERSAGEYTVTENVQDTGDPADSGGNALPDSEFTAHFDFDDNANNGVGAWAFSVARQGYNLSPYNTSQSGSFCIWDGGTTAISTPGFSGFWSDWANLTDAINYVDLLICNFPPPVGLTEYSRDFIFEYE